MKTAVVILNWNGQALLQKFLPSVIRYTPSAEVVVADNASTDDSLEWLAANYPEVTCIPMEVNRGYAGGYNEALSKIEADTIVLLNSDIEVTPNWLEPLTTHLNENPMVSICQPKIRSYKEKSSFEFAGAAGGMIDFLGYPFCRGRIFNTVEIDSGQYDSEQDIFWASGACMVIRKKVFEELDGFDHNFFAHMEEIDLCWRALNSGHEIKYIPRSTVYHLGGATLDKSNPKKTYLNFRNNLSMIYKNLPGSHLIPVIGLRLILDGIAGIKFLLEGHPADTSAVIRAHFHFYGRVLSRKIKRGINVSSLPKVVHKKSILLEYYVLGRKKFSDLKK